MADVKGCYTDEKLETNFININSNSLTIQDTGSLDKEISGNVYNVTNLSKTISGLEYSEGSSNFSKGEEPSVYDISLSAYKNTDRQNLLYNNLENTFLETQLKFDKQTKQITINMVLDEIDINLLSMNKEIVLYFTNTTHNAKYHGTYRVEKVNIQFTKKEAVDSLTAIVAVELIKIK